MRFTGTARLLAFDQGFGVEATTDWDPGNGAWSGVLTADLDWENLSPGDVLALEVPTPPSFSGPATLTGSVVVDLIVGNGSIGRRRWRQLLRRRASTPPACAVAFHGQTDLVAAPTPKVADPVALPAAG